MTLARHTPGYSALPSTRRAHKDVWATGYTIERRSRGQWAPVRLEYDRNRWSMTFRGSESERTFTEKTGAQLLRRLIHWLDGEHLR